MQLPWNLHIGSVVLSSHLLFEILAFLAGFRYYLYHRKSQGDAISDDKRLSIIIAAVLGAWLGSRFLAILEHGALIHGFRDLMVLLVSSKTVVGGLLGGLIGVEIARKMIGEKRSSGDLFTYPLILGMIIGRMGCFLSGVNDATHGLPSNLPWAMDLGDGLTRHPTALYEMIFLLGLAFFLRLVDGKYELENGFRFKLFMTAYLAWRLWVDSLKPSEPMLFSLSAIQLACVLGLCYYRKAPFILFKTVLMSGRKASV